MGGRQTLKPTVSPHSLSWTDTDWVPSLSSSVHEISPTKCRWRRENQKCLAKGPYRWILIALFFYSPELTLKLPDTGTISILYSQPVAALQILALDGTWKWIKHIDNAIVRVQSVLRTIIHSSFRWSTWEMRWIFSLVDCIKQQFIGMAFFLHFAL